MSNLRKIAASIVWYRYCQETDRLYIVGTVKAFVMTDRLLGRHPTKLSVWCLAWTLKAPWGTQCLHLVS